MVDIKNNTISLYTDSNKNEFVNKKIGDNFPNLEDQVYKIIKDKIIWHEIKMGERIIDKKLAEELGVSRSMVRQVLAILVKEEQLTMISRNGFYVREITRKEIEEIYNIRKILEAYATELAVPKIGSRDIAEVEKIFEKAKGDLEKDEVAFRMNLVTLDRRSEKEIVMVSHSSGDISTEEGKAIIESLKKDGSKALIPLKASNLTITELNLNDKKREQKIKSGVKND